VAELGGDQELVGHVEGRQDERDSRGQDDRGGLGVSPEVELGTRRDVAEGDSSSHDRDPGDPVGQRGIGPQGEGDVRQRTGSHQPAVCDPARGVDDGFYGGDGGGLDAQGGEGGTVESGLAVEDRRERGSGDQRPGRSRMYGCPQVEELGGDERIVGRAIKGSVAGHGGDGEEVGMPGGEQKGATMSSWPGSQSRIIGSATTYLLGPGSLLPGHATVLCPADPMGRTRWGGEARRRGGLSQ